MAQTQEISRPTHDPRAVKIIAKSLYRELTEGGYGPQEMIALSGELLGLVANGVHGTEDTDEVAS